MTTWPSLPMLPVLLLQLSYIVCLNNSHRSVTVITDCSVISSDGKNRFASRMDWTSESNTGIFNSVVVEYILYYRPIATLAVIELVSLAYVCSQKSHPSLHQHCVSFLLASQMSSVIYLINNKLSYRRDSEGRQSLRRLRPFIVIDFGTI